MFCWIWFIHFTSYYPFILPLHFVTEYEWFFLVERSSLCRCYMENSGAGLLEKKSLGTYQVCDCTFSEVWHDLAELLDLNLRNGKARQDIPLISIPCFMIVMISALLSWIFAGSLASTTSIANISYCRWAQIEVRKYGLLLLLLTAKIFV